MRENTDQKKLRIWILFTQCEIKFVVKEGSETGRDRVREKKIRILILPEFVKNSLNETGFLGIRLVFYCSYQK